MLPYKNTQRQPSLKKTKDTTYYQVPDFSPAGAMARSTPVAPSITSPCQTEKVRAVPLMLPACHTRLARLKDDDAYIVIRPTPNPWFTYPVLALANRWSDLARPAD